MNRFIASFTVAEQRIILFVLAALGLGCGLLRWSETRQSSLSFNVSEMQQQMPRMPDPVLPEGMNSAGLVDVNIADGKVLETLPGIGPAMAAAIMRHRDAAGPFTSMDDLDKVPGIGPAMMAKLAPMVTFGKSAGVATEGTGDTEISAAKGGTGESAAPSSPAAMPNSLTAIGAAAVPPNPHAININAASAGELDALVGVGPALAKRIIEDRYKNGSFEKPEDLDRVKGIGPSILRKNEGMIRVE